jgi:ATP-dependent protease ClpP protease subunit
MGRKKVRGFIDNWFDLNVDEETRTIYMGSIGKTYDDDETGVDSFMAEYFVKGMHILNSTSNKPITIIMNNPGGDWYHGMAIFDAIQTSTSACTVIVYGHAMSMGSIILQSADYRVMMPNSRFMIHFGYDGKYGHSKIFEKWADEGKRVNHQMENIYIRRLQEKEEEMGDGYIEKTINEIIKRNKQFEYPTKRREYKISKKDFVEDVRLIIQDMLNYDTILSPEETIALGWADAMVETKS